MASPEQFAARSRGRATAGARSKERGCTAADGADAGMRVRCQGGGRQLRVRAPCQLAPGPVDSRFIGSRDPSFLRLNMVPGCVGLACGRVSG